MSAEDSTDLAKALKSLSIAEIISAGPSIPFGRADRRNRQHLLSTVFGLPLAEQDLIRSAAIAKTGVQTLDIDVYPSRAMK
jgi:hypothetical protein